MLYVNLTCNYRKMLFVDNTCNGLVGFVCIFTGTLPIEDKLDVFAIRSGILQVEEIYFYIKVVYYSREECENVIYSIYP